MKNKKFPVRSLEKLIDENQKNRPLQKNFLCFMHLYINGLQLKIARYLNYPRKVDPVNIVIRKVSRVNAIISISVRIQSIIIQLK